MANNTRTVSIPLPPRIILKPVANALSIILQRIGRQNDLFGALQFTTAQATFCMDRAARLLNWHPRISLDEGMAQTERWLKSLN